MRQLPFMLIRLEKQRKSTPRFLKLELQTTASACKSFFLTRCLDVCCAQDGFPSLFFFFFFFEEKWGEKHFALSAVPGRAASLMPGCLSHPHRGSSLAAGSAMPTVLVIFFSRPPLPPITVTIVKSLDKTDEIITF